MAMDKLSDFKLGMGIVMKADRDWHDVGWPYAFIIARFLVLSSNSSRTQMIRDNSQSATD